MTNEYTTINYTTSDQLIAEKITIEQVITDL